MNENQPSISFVFQILFLIIALFNEIHIQVFNIQAKTHQINCQEEMACQLDYLNGMVNYLNIGILVFDQNYKLIYRTQHMDKIESFLEFQNQTENITYNPNRSESQNIANLKLLTQKQTDNISFLEDIKVSGYSQNESITKKILTLKQIIENAQNIDFECNYYKFKIIGPNQEKLRYYLKFSQMIKKNQTIFIFSFQLINENYVDIKKDQKFRNNLISSFSHKLKTPLHAVITYLEICLNDQNLTKQLIDTYIKPCYWNSKILLYTIQDILDYVSYYSYQRQNLNVKTINIMKLISEIKDLIITQCSQKSIQFRINYNNEDFDKIQEFCFVQSDLNKLMRILVNLLNNAYRFTPQGGFIELDVDEVRKGDSRLIQFTISDSGVGLSQQAQEEIAKQMQMHQYQQQQRSRKQSQLQTQSIDKGKCQQNLNPKNEVLGISLKITTKLIYQLNGTSPFKIESLPGQGSKFSFCIGDLDLPSGLHPQSARRIKNISMRSNRIIADFLTLQSETNCGVEDEKTVVGQIRKIDRVKPSMLKSLNSNYFRQNARVTQRNTKLIQGTTQIRQTQKRSKQNLVEESGAIVVVDDEPFNHISLEMVLNSLGYNRIVHCYNGQEVVDFVKRQKNIRIRTVLMDVDMPVMDGITATSILSNLMEQEKINPFQIIACTAHEDEETKQQCYEAGVEQIVVKPVFSSILKDALQIQH
ncbi:unnamed protein product (macronuclear) [Paramecium tetraurelia]|uniref:Response regulatory domain-containing protein n=1 Tax=Paramecium tetraurelia TaxID=5888 RepID=A0DYP0_PARTE|nr:uncharacterized protein GSPATT00003125001 [Paramecium tetraurelia]CAK88157.1 unnamed protein product [Paramecium tetraurelia]|eukprot:XP_001455554.1 hypothetical protein (macronuclear) [Paramecium tetraurelia strain d4-2]